MLDHFEAAWATTHALERGYVNDPADPGGETNHGITVAVARAHGYMGPMRDLPMSLATLIARSEYWDKLHLDSVAQWSVRIAGELFDTNLNFWGGASVKFLQRALNGLQEPYDLIEDGKMGSTTLERLATFLRTRPAGEVVMLRALNSQQCSDYLRQAALTPAKRRFLYGWILNRVQMDASQERRA